MSNLNHKPHPDALDQATAAIRDVAVPPGPSPELLAATVAALRSQVSPASQTQQTRRRMIRYIGYGTATAAAVGLLVLAGVLWSGGSATAHFQKALDNAEKAKSVTATATVVTDGKFTSQHKMIRVGDALRAEVSRTAPGKCEEVLVADLKTGQAVKLFPATKTYWKLTFGQQERQGLNGMLGDFTTLKELAGGDAKAVKPVGEEQLGGRATKVYEVRGTLPPVVWKVWIDPKTDFLIRARAEEASDQSSLTIDYEDWNKEHDAKLFRLEVPAGYELKDAPRTPVGAPVLSLLRQAAEKAAKAKSFRYVAVYIPLDDPAALPRRVTNLYRGPLQRMEALDQSSITVCDWAGKRVLELDTAAKTATWVPVTDAEAAETRRQIAELPRLVADQFKGNPDYDLKERPREVVNGRPTQVLEARRKPGAKAAKPDESVVELFVVWIDAETGFPARFRERSQQPAGRREAVGLFDQWDEELDAKLFSLDVPAGYKLVEAKKE